MGTIGPIVSDRTENRVIQGLNCRVGADLQYKYRSQPRNHSAPLPYYRRNARVTNTDASSFADCLNWGAMSWISYRGSGPRDRCAQTAYNKLVGKLKSMEQGWGENLATRKQTFDMMLHRIGTLTLAARRLKKGDIPGFCRALGVTPRPSKSKLKNLSSTWLEYHFGWEPLYGDIYTACKMLSADVPGGTISGTGVETIDLIDGNINYIPSKITGRVVVKLQGDYYVDNPNKFLLNQMGVINPISVAWELVPFSFAVDWFIPIGQYLGGLTDFFGVHRANEFTTAAYFIKGLTWRQYALPRDPTETEAVVVERKLGISVPKPVFKLFRGFSPVRGATAIALLIGTLRSLG